MPAVKPKRQLNLRAAFLAATEAVNAAELIEPKMADKFSFGEIVRRRGSIYSAILDKLEDAKVGAAIRLKSITSSVVPVGLKNLAKKRGITLEYAKDGDYLLVRINAVD